MCILVRRSNSNVSFQLIKLSFITGLNSSPDNYPLVLRASGCTSPPWVPKHRTTCVPSFSFCLSFFRRQINGRCGGSAEVYPQRPGHPAKPAAGRRPLLAHRSPTAPPPSNSQVMGRRRRSEGQPNTYRFVTARHSRPRPRCKPHTRPKRGTYTR